MASELEIDYEQVLAALDQLTVEELAGVVDRASTLLKKAIAKGIPSKKKVGVIPSQLEQNHEWIKYVLGDARLNGWESFEMRCTKTNKTTGEKVIEEVVMAGSVERVDGVHVFSDTGNEMSQGHAMCYSKLLKDRNDIVYQTFLENYGAVCSGPVKKAAKVVKKTSAEVEAEKAVKEAEKKAEKEFKEAQKKAEKAAKEAEKAAEKKKKEDEKAAAEAAKVKPVARAGILVPVKRERTASPAPAATTAPAVAVEEEEAAMPALEALPTIAAPITVVPVAAPVAAPVATVVPKKMVKKVPVKAARPEVDPFEAGPSGEKRWEWNGVLYVRYADNLMYLWDAENKEYGAFQGRYNYELDAIEKCEEPTTEDLVEEEDLGA